MFDFLSAEAACLVERKPDTGKDIWRQTVAEMFGVPYDKVTSEQRDCRSSQMARGLYYRS